MPLCRSRWLCHSPLSRHSLSLRPVLIALVLAMIPLAASANRTVGWTTYTNARFGLEIQYPGGLFTRDLNPGSDSGRALATEDGRGKLLVGALENTDGLDLKGYRDFVLENTFPGAKVDYSRLGKSFFVVSGKRGEDHFYQWVAFICGGQLIASWAMVYPDAERKKYDPLVEIIAKTFRSGRNVECPSPS